jgi:hypothetical protein
VEFELDIVGGVKTDDGSCLGGVGDARMTFGVPGCLDGVIVSLPLGLGLGLPFEPSYFPLAPGEFP